MCGIIGFAGRTEAVEVLLDGLERLEYRGYDSAGIAVFEHNKINGKRLAVCGSISQVANKIFNKFHNY